MVQAKKRGLNKKQKLRQISQFFLARNFTLSGSRHGGKIGRSGKFELIFDANASVDKSLSIVLLIHIYFKKETNRPYGIALSSRKRLLL